MTEKSGQQNQRILIVDDNPDIHDDFCKILLEDAAASVLDDLEAELFDAQAAKSTSLECELDSALQGQEALAKVEAAVAEGRPYALAFVDMRMPPGWDGLETIEHLWQTDPQLQVCICTAYSDYSWSQVLGRIGESDQLLILKKPFDSIEVKQIANALVKKWNLSRQVEREMLVLEDRVRERTQDLEAQKNNLKEAMERLEQTQEQLMQAEKMASVGQLAAGVAHEINNPLGFISSNLSTLGEYANDVIELLNAESELLNLGEDADADYSAKIKKLAKIRADLEIDQVVDDLLDLVGESIEGAERIKDIVQDLKEFSHKDNSEIAQADLNIILDKTLNVARNEVKYKAEVVKDYGELPLIACYAGRLGQVFLNLLVNAAHAIADRGTITVSTRQVESSVEVKICDTGSGIPAEVKARIFDPFFTTKEVGKGTGLGLHLAFKLVNLHSGTIDVDTKVGQGTTFIITLPVAGPKGDQLLDTDIEKNISKNCAEEEAISV